MNCKLKRCEWQRFSSYRKQEKILKLVDYISYALYLIQVSPREIYA
jgi:hypothetical protein